MSQEEIVSDKYWYIFMENITAAAVAERPGPSEKHWMDALSCGPKHNTSLLWPLQHQVCATSFLQFSW